MGIDLNDLLCPVCLNQVEDNSHAFLKCDWSSTFWSKISHWCGLDLHNFDTIDNMFEWIEQRRGKEMERKILGLNIVWEHRNGVLFDKKEMSPIIAFTKTQDDSLCWVINRAKKLVIDRRIWIQSPFKEISM
ncbi:hypothetical protein LXL04_033081 [Taraxacum kok-saghyz]